MVQADRASGLFWRVALRCFSKAIPTITPAKAFPAARLRYFLRKALPLSPKKIFLSATRFFTEPQAARPILAELPVNGLPSVILAQRPLSKAWAIMPANT